jgi:hypothetical protein
LRLRAFRCHQGKALDRSGEKAAEIAETSQGKHPMAFLSGFQFVFAFSADFSATFAVKSFPLSSRQSL